MSKKKTKKQRSKRKNQRANKQVQPSTDQDKQAIKTMMIGVVIISLFILFFSLKIDGQTMFNRLTADTESNAQSQSLR